MVPVLNPLEDEWDAMYDKAVAESQPLPFGRFERIDMDAYRFRGIRKEDPCLFSSLIRRVTYDVEKCKRPEDVYKAEVPDGFSWRAKLPGGRTTISTKFYFHL